MLFPTAKMDFTPIYQGNKSDDGWLVLNIGNVELEGVTKIYIDLKDVETIKANKAAREDALDKTKKLLGG